MGKSVYMRWMFSLICFADMIHFLSGRTLMIREALILLNRLVSHPQYAGSVLLALTNRREIAKLTVDIASILSHKGKCLSHCDSITQKIRESEIVELARVFQKRVYTFLGSNSGKKPS